MRVGAGTGRLNSFRQLAQKEGWGRVVFAAFILPIMLWQAGSAFLHRYQLEHSGILQSAVIEQRILKHCHGFRCSSPVFFDGEVGSPAYNEFTDNCGKSCWWLVRYHFSWKEREYSITESVYPNRFEKLSPGSPIQIYVDENDPTQSEIKGSTKDSGIIFVLYIFGGFGAFVALLLLGKFMNRVFYGDGGYNSRY